MKTTADMDRTKRTRLVLLALGAVCVGCVLMIAAAVLAGRNYKALVPLALVSSIVVNAIAVALSRFQKEAETEDAKTQENRLAFGMLLGLALGAALDGCGVFESPMIGLTLGSLWGMALSTLGAKPKDANVRENRKKPGGKSPCNTKKKLS